MDKRTWLLDKTLKTLGLEVDQPFRVKDKMFASHAETYGINEKMVFMVDEVGDLYYKPHGGYVESPITFSEMLANASCEARLVPVEDENKMKAFHFRIKQVHYRTGEDMCEHIGTVIAESEEQAYKKLNERFNGDYYYGLKVFEVTDGLIFSTNSL